MTQSLIIHTTKGSCKANCNRLRLKVATSQEEKRLVIKGKCHDYCSYTIDACVLYMLIRVYTCNNNYLAVNTILMMIVVQLTMENNMKT